MQPQGKHKHKCYNSLANTTTQKYKNQSKIIKFMRKNFTLCTSILLLALSTGGGITARADGEVLKTVAAAAGKSFTIKCARGYWYAYGKGNNSNVIAGSKGDLESVNDKLDFKDLTATSKFTIVEQTKSDNTKRFYLYSIDTKKWVVTNGYYLGLADKPYEADSICFIASTGGTKATYPTCIYFAGNENNMYGVSYAYSPDVYKWHDLGDEGNMSVVSVSGTLADETYQALVSSLNNTTGFYAAKTISASPIAYASDFNGQDGKAYLIHNVSGGRNGYLHVDTEGNLTYQGIPGDHADLSNFIFTTEKSGDNIYLKNGGNRYIPVRTGSSQPFTTITDKIAGAGIATVVAKNGYKATTFNFKIDGHYMNVNPEGVVVTYDDATDINGVWEFMPVDNNDFTTTNIVRHITIQNGVRLDGGSVTYSSDNTNSSARKYRIGQHIYFPTTVDFLSGGLSENAVATNTNTTIAVTERLPFEVITEGKDTVWYNLNLRNNSSPKWMSATSSGSVTLSTTFTDNNYSQWAFKGSSATGIQLYNKGLGTTYTLKGTTTPTLTTANGNNNFIIIKNNDGFVLKTSRYNNNCMNDVNGSLGYWNHTNAPTDDGSTFRVFLPKGFYTMLNYQKATGADAAYGYLGLPADANNKTNVMGNDATVSLNDVVYIAPASAPSSSTVDPRYVTMQLQGKNIQGVSPSTQVTVGDNKVSFMVTRPNVGYFAFGSAVSNATPANQSYLHTANSQSYQVVGWSTDAVATSWQVSPAGAITMTATQVGGKYYATFYAPFAVKLSGAKAYTLTLNTDKTSATLNEVQLTNSILPKESAVLIIADGANYTVEPVIDATEKVSSILTGVSLAESWSSHENDLVLGYVNDKIGFYKWGTNNTLKNNRCYLPATKLNTTATAKGVVIDFGTVTGINAATLNPAKADGKIYNLQGQEVSRSYKGVVIKNGRKVIQ